MTHSTLYSVYKVHHNDFNDRIYTGLTSCNAIQHNFHFIHKKNVSNIDSNTLLAWIMEVMGIEEILTLTFLHMGSFVCSTLDISSLSL